MAACAMGVCAEYAHTCRGTFILLSWMPMYYQQHLGMDLLKSGIFSVLPWITMAIFANVGGWIADTMIHKGMSVTRVRKIMQTVSIHHFGNGL